MATCLCDVLISIGTDHFSADHFSASDFLHHFLLFLAGFRNHKSQYFEPLAQKMGSSLVSMTHPRLFPEAGTVEDECVPRAAEILGAEQALDSGSYSRSGGQESTSVMPRDEVGVRLESAFPNSTLG